mmetsp:Transcript_37635/g.120718  ORF Transcript_37635/g.120718 Transcript_37635/m.120718 type:complete len:254 (+) Transcript_37635:496-1257(+)
MRFSVRAVALLSRRRRPRPRVAAVPPVDGRLAPPVRPEPGPPLRTTLGPRRAFALLRPGRGVVLVGLRDHRPDHALAAPDPQGRPGPLPDHRPALRHGRRPRQLQRQRTLDGRLWLRFLHRPRPRAPRSQAPRTALDPRLLLGLRLPPRGPRLRGPPRRREQRKASTRPRQGPPRRRHRDPRRRLPSHVRPPPPGRTRPRPLGRPPPQPLRIAPPRHRRHLLQTPKTTRPDDTTGPHGRPTRECSGRLLRRRV